MNRYGPSTASSFGARIPALVTISIAISNSFSSTALAGTYARIVRGVWQRVRLKIRSDHGAIGLVGPRGILDKPAKEQRIFAGVGIDAIH